MPACVDASALNSNTRAQDVEGGVYYEWCPSKDALLDRSDVFVSRAGHATISDLILRGKPSVLVPIRSQMEQMGNAEKAARLGVAADLSEDRLTEDSLRDAIRMLESEETIRRVKALQAYASGFDAAGSIVSALRN